MGLVGRISKEKEEEKRYTFVKWVNDVNFLTFFLYFYFLLGGRSSGACGVIVIVVWLWVMEMLGFIVSVDGVDWLLALTWSQPRHPLMLARVVVVGQSRGSVTLSH